MKNFKELLFKLTVIRNKLINENDLNNINIIGCFSRSELLVKDKSDKTRKEQQIIASIQVLTSSRLEIDNLYNLFHNIDNQTSCLLSSNNLTLFLIKPQLTNEGKDKTKEFKIGSGLNTKTITIHIISITSFIKDIDKILKIKYNNDDLGLSPIFIFKGISWSNIVYLFKLQNKIINGGSLSNRHKLSKVELRLSLFLSLLRLLDGFDINTMFKTSLDESLVTKAKYDKDFYLYSKDNYIYREDDFNHTNQYIKCFVETNYLLNLVLSGLNIMGQKEQKDLELKQLEDNLEYYENQISPIKNRIIQKEKKSVNKTSTISKAALTGQIHNMRQEINDLLNEVKKINDKKSTIEKSLNDINNQIEESSNIVSNYLNKYEYKQSLSRKTTINKNNLGKRNYSTSSLKEKNNEDNTLDNKNSNKVYSIGSSLFNHLNRMLIDSPLNQDTQLKIECFLVNQADILFQEKINEVLDLNYNILSPDLIKIINNSKKVLNLLIKNMKENLNVIEDVSEQIFLFQKLIEDCEDQFIISLVLGRLLKIYSNKNTINQNTIFTDVAIDLGSDLVNNYFASLYNKKVKRLGLNTELYTLTDWLEENKDTVSNYKNSSRYFYFGSHLINLLLEAKLVENQIITKSKNDKQNILIPSKSLYDKIGEFKLSSLPNKIPMIVKPKDYIRKNVDGKVKEILGGYLLNNIKYSTPIIIDNWELKNPSIITDENIIYDMVNNLSSVAYKINNDVLDFILEHGLKLDLILDPNKIHSLTNKVDSGIKLTIRERKEYESYLSQKQLEMNIIGLAMIYKNIPEFYIPIRIDNRGRAYCYTDYLNYQSIELAKSLLLFSKEEKINTNDINAINFLKIYGANCFGNGLEKKSFEDRIKWVNDNENDILDFKNNDIINKAESKLLFIAFCFEYSKYYNAVINSYSYFYSGLPIQLDATCNGYQHLALLTGDDSLAKELNLTNSTWYDKPKDFYTYVALNIKDYFKDKINKINKGELIVDNINIIESYQRLGNLDIQRALIKKPIMTKPYNVTQFQMIKYIEEEFIPEEDNWHVYKKDSNIRLKSLDFNILGKAIDTVIYKNFPKLNDFSQYLKVIAYICIKLNITIPWYLPSGLNVNQEYIDTDYIRIKPFIYKKSSFNLKIPNKNKINKNKQIRALMPNLVHSLDGASLALLVDLFFKNDNIKIKNFYSVHDCFAVTANNVNDIMNKIKIVYIIIYSDNNYLINFDRGIRNHIKLQFGEDSLDEENLKIQVNNLILQYPNIMEVIDGNYTNLLEKSSYLIN